MRQAILLEPSDLDQLRRGVGLHLALGNGEGVTLLFATRSVTLATQNGHVTVSPNGRRIGRPAGSPNRRKLTLTPAMLAARRANAKKAHAALRASGKWPTKPKRKVSPAARKALLANLAKARAAKRAKKKETANA